MSTMHIALNYQKYFYRTAQFGYFLNFNCMIIQHGHVQLVYLLGCSGKRQATIFKVDLNLKSIRDQFPYMIDIKIDQYIRTKIEISLRAKCQCLLSFNIFVSIFISWYFGPFKTMLFFVIDCCYHYLEIYKEICWLNSSAPLQKGERYFPSKTFLY